MNSTIVSVIMKPRFLENGDDWVPGVFCIEIAQFGFIGK